ncbi:MAG: hypothetical protein LBG47_02490 [Prevotellaceae bacterium]|nr:hypothetical protein [Prevotellaceae bacterium]
MRLIRLNICIVLLCCMFAACSGNDEKWEPKMAVSLASFEIDISEYLRIEEFTANFFSILGPSMQKAALKRAILSLDTVDASVGANLPGSLRGDWYGFPHDQSGTGIGAPIEAKKFLGKLLPVFRSNKQFFAINHFACEIVAEAARQDSVLIVVAEEQFAYYAGEVDFSIAHEVEFAGKMGQIQELELQFFASSRLMVMSDIQLKLLDADSMVPLDSFEFKTPIPNANREEPHVYERDEAKSIIQSLNKVNVSVFSDSLGLTFTMLQDLHSQKINASIGAIVKMAINDNEAGQ